MKQINEYANILTLRKISSLFKTTFKNVDELLNIVLETAQVTVGALNASLLMLDEKTNKLQFYQASGEESDQLKQVDIPQTGQVHVGWDARARRREDRQIGGQ